MIFYVIIAFFIIYGIIGEYKDSKKNKQPLNNRKKHSTIHTNVSGHLCYDCTHCNTSKSNSQGQVYCKWDNEYYLPETGINCDDFIPINDSIK